MALAQQCQDRIVDRIDRREVQMPALGRDDMVATMIAQDRRHAKTGPWPDDRDRTAFAQWSARTADVRKMFFRELRDRVADCSEVVDEHVRVDAQACADQPGANRPGIVRQLQRVAAHRARDRLHAQARNSAAP